MPTRRLADRQIRAAQQAALRLDVRGPVSQALGKTGIAVPPVEPSPDAAAASAPPAEPTPAPARRPADRGLRPTVKPFQETAWPTRRDASAAPAPLTGLTADERRVHQILLDTLEITSRNDDYAAGLSYAEKQRLGALDLAFINAQLAKMDRRGEVSAAVAKWAGGVGVLALVGAVAGALATGADAGTVGLVVGLCLFALLSIGALSAAAVTSPVRGSVGGQRRKIYEALRELALLVEPDGATSDAVAEADRLIDRLALDDLGGEPDAAPARRSRVRS